MDSIVDKKDKTIFSPDSVNIYIDRRGKEYFCIENYTRKILLLSIIAR